MIKGKSQKGATNGTSLYYMKASITPHRNTVFVLSDASN
jgi:hypothetical protein